MSRKGGVGKTTTTVQLGHTFASHRGDLGRVVGVGAQRLREAGRRTGGREPGPAGATAFARVGAPDPQFAPADALGRAAPPPPEPRDEIDELFTGASGPHG
jgi:hypothetical protein